MNRKINFMLMLVVVIFSSCKSLPKFKGEADLCGLIVDENNAPVKDFVIYCKNDFATNTALTDESGMFVVHGLNSDTYKISGQKKNFVKMDDEQFMFTDRSKIFFFQVESIEGAFKSVEQFIARGEFEKADELLNKLYYEKNSPQEAVILMYRFFLSEENDEKTKIVSAIKNVGQINGEDYSNYTVLLEDLIYEK